MYEKKDNRNLVSVIVPVYNAERYIEKTLESIVLQDYLEKEVIIVDDCSTDNSYEIIHEFMNKFSYIHYYRLSQNSGVAIARNKAIEMAKGRFIAFLDSDDIWKQGKLSNQIRLFDKHKGIPFTYTAISYIDEDGNFLKGKRNLKEEVSYSYILRNTCIATSTVIIDRSIVNQVIMPNRKSAEDYSLWLSILKKYGNAYGINEAYTLYRKSANSISANKLLEIHHFYNVQLKDLELGRIHVLFNTLCYIINAVKKHFF